MHQPVAATFPPFGKEKGGGIAGTTDSVLSALIKGKKRMRKSTSTQENWGEKGGGRGELRTAMCGTFIFRLPFFGGGREEKKFKKRRGGGGGAVVFAWGGGEKEEKEKKGKGGKLILINRERVTGEGGD